VIAIALDESAERVTPLAEGITLPVLIDRDHRVTELLAVSNVPTVIWVDEQDRIVRPNAAEFSNDMFSEFSGVYSGPHLEMLRAWVRDGAPPPEEERDAEIADLSDDEVAARLHFRLAAHLRRHGNDDAAAEQFAKAESLAPLDFTIARAAMPLTGRDPFGQEFFDLYEKWKSGGKPFHGLRVSGQAE
jgi:hypothetical protein